MSITTSAAGQPSQRLQNPYSRLPDWFYPTMTAFWLGLFALYGLVVTVGDFKVATWGPYLSPFDSPDVAGRILPPALWVAWVPLIFRGTCYYYRKAIFRGFLSHPRSCARTEPDRGTYYGETRFFIYNQLHRFAMYLGVVILLIDIYDAFRSLAYQGHVHFGFGSALMLVNVVCLAGWTFGCHAIRHLVGGGKDCLSCIKTRYQLWKGVSVLNVNHSTWAWVSMFTVWSTDLYIRLLAHGWLPHGWWS
ncbi:MAG TPA: hypothetical protein VIA06_15035 [Candidatus Dormibacteraeota bacterium]|nr:hypothetical protein [Candidatus Dormibacteraeota bacterium]